MCGLMVCGVDVSVCTGCIMGCVVITGAPVSERETGNGICMMPWGMVTIGPAGFMMVGIAAALEMCMSMLFCRLGEEEKVWVNTTVNTRCTSSHRNPRNVIDMAQIDIAQSQITTRMPKLGRGTQAKLRANSSFVSTGHIQPHNPDSPFLAPYFPHIY